MIELELTMLKVLKYLTHYLYLSYPYPYRSDVEIERPNYVEIPRNTVMEIRRFDFTYSNDSISNTDKVFEH